MVKMLHRAGIEVILDVVFNHSAEGNHEGPTLSFKGIDNATYYLLEENPLYYSNYSGCGNTLKANHAVVGRLILDSLRYWVSQMHVDGFRFDLASVLSRDLAGQPLEDPPILWSIESDPILAGTKLIAEAWDAAGLYQVGSFIGDRFAEWNGPYRDQVRQFLKGDAAMVPKLADRLLGSPDIYRQPNREPNRSIHFVT
jgi:glycogen operon protein